LRLPVVGLGVTGLVRRPLASRLVTVTVVITAAMMASDRPVPICGTGTGPTRCTPDSSSASVMSFIPMKARMADRPAERCGTRPSSPPMRK
jgi:hypothetical protein